ncbi:MAG: hypothetical protein GY757_16450 [bacterium]|nr:hypothetical protein [bacterium]
MMILRKRVSVLFLAVMITLLFLDIGCAKAKTVIICSPYERYDHNRTRELVVEYPGGTEQCYAELTNEIYAPYGTSTFPKVNYRQTGNAGGRIPVANLVPVFTGLQLPLSRETTTGKSDYKDLVDYLAAGPLAYAGVEPGAMAGDDITLIEARYQPLLQFLESKDKLKGSRTQVILNISVKARVLFAKKVIDTRYRDSSFSEPLGFCYRDFCFILYRTPGSESYTRLVVVPGKFIHKIKNKGLIGGEGR